jgi:imidazolonepropionase-like amidohydrolase
VQDVTATAARAWALVNAHLIDGNPGGYAGHGGVLIEDSRIKASGPDVSRDSIGDMPFVDVGNRTVMPGLIDCHAHLTWNAVASPVATLVEERAVPVRLALRAASNAVAALERGSTTVRDLGSPNEVIFPLRDAIREGICRGPRILAAGYVITTPNGHCHYVGQHATDPERAREAAAKQIEAGADVIKVMTSGGLHTPGSDPTTPQFSLESLHAIVEIAHAAGRRVTGHATCDAAIGIAIRAGFDSIQHGTNLEPDTATALAHANVSVTPTLDTRYFLNMHMDDPAVPEVIRSRARATAHDRSAAYGNALEAGVTVTAGTDSGTTFVPHGALATEIRLMHEGGLSIRQALAAATWLAAAEVGLPREIGTLAAGAYADLLVVDGDPLEDLSALENVTLVIQSGALAFRSPDAQAAADQLAESKGHHRRDQPE